MKVAVIPARSGSKRIPNKNIRSFLGKPMLSWALEETLRSRLFDRVVVSTDSALIAELAIGLGAEVPFLRDAKNSDDHATIADVLTHALSELSREQTISWLCCIYATAPMIKSSDLAMSYEQLMARDANQCLSVCEFPFPPQRALAIDDKGLLSMQYPEYQNTRSQDLPTLYQDAAHFFWTHSDVLRSQQVSKRIAYKVERSRVLDIDTEEDWFLAERAMKIQLELEQRT